MKLDIGINTKTLTGLQKDLPGGGLAVTQTGKTYTAMEKLQKELDELEKQYQLYGKNTYDLPNELDLEKMDYTGLSDEEIASYAKAKLTEEYLRQLNALNADIERGKTDLETYKEKLNEAGSAAAAEIDSVYAAAARNTSDDALKRGLARSSIVVNKLSDLEQKKSGDKLTVSQQLIKSIADIDNQINKLETGRLKSLDDLDIIHAAKLETEINRLKNEREARLDDILKYNNSLKEKEAGYALDYAKTDSSLDGDLYSRASDSIKNDLASRLAAQIAEQKYLKVAEFLNGVSKADALNYLKNNERFFTEQLGVGYYKKLLSEQNSR